jgi:hypothetical protein
MEELRAFYLWQLERRLGGIATEVTRVHFSSPVDPGTTATLIGA